MLSCVDAWGYRGVCDCVAVCCSEYIAVCCSVFRCVVAVGHRAALQKHADICCNVHMLFEDATTMRQTPHTTLYCTAYRLHGDMCGITHPCTFYHSFTVAGAMCIASAANGLVSVINPTCRDLHFQLCTVPVNREVESGEGGGGGGGGDEVEDVSGVPTFAVGPAGQEAEASSLLVVTVAGRRCEKSARSSMYCIAQ